MKGLGTALVTPFTENGKIDFQALGRLIEHQVVGGTDYLVVSCIPSWINRPTLKSACMSMAIYCMVSEGCCVKSMSKSNWRAVSSSLNSVLGRSVNQLICFYREV